MAYRFEKNGEITIDGFEQGIAPSPHKGIANIQNANISTETGEVMCSYARVQQSQTNSIATGTLTASSGFGSYYLGTSFTLQAGIWITVSSSTITSLPAGNYYVDVQAVGNVQLSNFYDPTYASPISHGTTGTASFTILRNMGKLIASATEKYSDGTNFQYRYYVLDANGLVWVQDTGVTVAGITWFLPDYSLLTNATGLSVLNGWLMAFAGNTIWCKSTVNLGDTTVNSSTWSSFASGIMVSPTTSPNPHFAFVGHQGKCYYTDGNYLGSIFPNTSLLSGTVNVQSYGSYTAPTSADNTLGTISVLINGSLPTNSTSSTRIPAVFFPQAGKANPTALTTGTIYYIAYSTGGATFQVFAAATGGAALDLVTGATGTLFYFNTFYPVSAGGNATITFTPQRLILPAFETSTCMAELGNQVIIGTKSNVLYPWNQVDPTPSDLIPLPENNVVNLLTVNNMVYVFAGSKGNIYLTNGSTASLALTVPDYTAGIAGTATSYFEPYFTWGGVMYLRGRVYFSILDQTASKAGNCGGVWSFIPTQNIFIGQDVGLALRLENQNSYASYNGYATVLLPSQNQGAISPQYWSGWQSAISAITYGIDFTDTKPTYAATIESDLIPVGTMLDKKTQRQIEYKLSAPLVSGDSVAISWRQNATSAFTSCGTAITEGATSLSGYFTANFQGSQWVQLKITLNNTGTASSSMCRLTKIIMR